MKTLSKITLMALALFISNGLSAQGKSGGRGNSPLKNHVKTVPIKTSEHARVTGSLNANAHANKIAKRNANSHSVLNTDKTIVVTHKKKHHHRHHRKF